MSRVDAFLLGVIAMGAVTAAVYFFKFWRSTRDPLFLAFAASFFIEGLNRAAFLALAHPNEGNVWMYSIRLVSFLLILGAILRKNFGGD